MKEQIKKMLMSRKQLRKQTNNIVSETYIDMFIQNLETLLEAEEPHEVEIKKIQLYQIEWEENWDWLCDCVEWWYMVCKEERYCSWCWRKIKRVD